MVVLTATQIVLQGMVGSGWGRIINISSVVRQTSNFGQVNDAATKGAIISLTESLARELARKGITVTAVAPGFIEVDMVSGMPEEAVEQVKALTRWAALESPRKSSTRWSFWPAQNRASSPARSWVSTAGCICKKIACRTCSGQSGVSHPVAQVVNLLYRRLAIGQL